ncbi:hypothetical protein THAOC_20644, partial [Thalassiosira oceanica]
PAVRAPLLSRTRFTWCLVFYRWSSGFFDGDSGSKCKGGDSASARRAPATFGRRGYAGCLPTDAGRRGIGLIGQSVLAGRPPHSRGSGASGGESQSLFGFRSISSLSPDVGSGGVAAESSAGLNDNSDSKALAGNTAGVPRASTKEGLSSLFEAQQTGEVDSSPLDRAMSMFLTPMQVKTPQGGSHATRGFLSELLGDGRASKGTGTTFRLVLIDKPEEMCKYPVGGLHQGQACADSSSGCSRKGHFNKDVGWADEITTGCLAILVRSPKSIYISRSSICTPDQVAASPSGSVLNLLNQELAKPIIFNITKQVQQGVYESQHQDTEAMIKTSPGRTEAPQTPRQKDALKKRENIADEVVQASQMAYALHGLLGTPSEDQTSPVFEMLHFLTVGAAETSEAVAEAKQAFDSFVERVRVIFEDASQVISNIEGRLSTLTSEFGGFRIAGGRSNPDLENKLRLALGRIEALELANKSAEERATALETANAGLAADVTLAMEAAADAGAGVGPGAVAGRGASVTYFVSEGTFNTAIEKLEAKVNQVESAALDGVVEFAGPKYAMCPWLLLQYVVKRLAQGGYKQVTKDMASHTKTKKESWELISLASLLNTNPEAFAGVKELTTDERAKGVVYKKLPTILAFQDENSSESDAYTQLLLEEMKLVVKDAVKRNDVELSVCAEFKSQCNALWSNSLAVWEWIIENLPIKYKKTLAAHCSGATTCPPAVGRKVFRVFMLTLEEAHKRCREKRQGMTPYVEDKSGRFTHREMATQFFLSSLHSLKIMKELRDLEIVKDPTFTRNSELVARSTSATKADIEALESKMVKKKNHKDLTAAVKVLVCGRTASSRSLAELVVTSGLLARASWHARPHHSQQASATYARSSAGPGIHYLDAPQTQPSSARLQRQQAGRGRLKPGVRQNRVTTALGAPAMALLNRERSRPRDRGPMGALLNAGVPAPGLGSHEALQNAGKRGGDDVLEARPVRRRVDNTPSALNAGRSKQKFGAAVGWAHVVLAWLRVLTLLRKASP